MSGGWRRVDQGLQEDLPGGEGKLGRDGAEVLEKRFARPFGGPGLDPDLFEAVAGRVDYESEQVHGGEHVGKVLRAAAKVVFEAVAV